MAITGRFREAPYSRIPDWAWDVAAVVVVIGVAVFPGPKPRMMPPDLWQLLPLTEMFAAGALLLRRSWPLPVFVFCVSMYCVSAITGVSSLGVGVAAVIAVFSLANRVNRLTAFLSGGIAAALVAVLSVTVAELGVVDPRVFQVAAGLAVATALGDSSRSRREYLAAVTERAERAEQTREAEAHRRVAEERLRIAQDLHDTVAHRISVISLNAGIASNALDTRPEKAREALGTIQEAARAVLSEIGGLLRYLRDSEVSSGALPPQLGLDQLGSLLQSIAHTGLQVRTEVTGDLARVTGTTDLVAYRIVQEGLTNAHKHGAEHWATLSILVQEEAVVMTIVNPVRADTEGRSQVPGEQLGLLGIQERVASVRGQVQARREGSYFLLSATLPIPRQAER